MNDTRTVQRLAYQKAGKANNCPFCFMQIVCMEDVCKHKRLLLPRVPVFRSQLRPGPAALQSTARPVSINLPNNTHQQIIKGKALKMSRTASSLPKGVDGVQLQDENGNYIQLEGSSTDLNGNYIQFEDSSTDLNGNYVQPEVASKSLKRQQIHLHSEFVAVGAKVKVAVDNRAELYKKWELYKEKFVKLQVEDEETGLDDIDETDPLRFIESEYSFFQNDLLCSVKDIGNVEDPKACILAMDNFVKILHENVHRFKHLPKGPLYKEIKIKNRKWAALAEYVLRPFLFSFIVDNIVDSLVIEELIEQHFPSCATGIVTKGGVVCPTFHLFPFTNQVQIDSRITEVSGMELENMLEAIHFGENIWEKFLSDILSIEKIVFMENENSAFLVMSHIRNTPWHCKLAYTLDGYCVHPFPCFRTKKIRCHSRPYYLKCLPNEKIKGIAMKMMRTENRIIARNREIKELRDMQMELAMQLDAISAVYETAKAKEKGEKPKTKKKGMKQKNK